MAVKIAVLRKTKPGERRIAMVPSVVEKLIKLGATLAVQTRAGAALKLADSAFPLR